ncbi:MAG: hypothetical protein V7706_06750 [Dietzia psychralcaliphila]
MCVRQSIHTTSHLIDPHTHLVRPPIEFVRAVLGVPGRGPGDLRGNVGLPAESGGLRRGGPRGVECAGGGSGESLKGSEPVDQVAGTLGEHGGPGRAGVASPVTHGRESIDERLVPRCTDIGDHGESGGEPGLAFATITLGVGPLEFRSRQMEFLPQCSGLTGQPRQLGEVLTGRVVR